MTGKSGLYKNTNGAKEHFDFAEATPKDELELKDTVALMNSADYKDRFMAEYMQLDIRTKKLEEMINKYKRGELNFTPSCTISMLESQLETMKEYRLILHMRAKKENIMLPADDDAPVAQGKHITRDEASDFLYSLVNTGAFGGEAEEKLAEIANLIDDESIGYHFWGADTDERAKLFTAVRSDLITDEHREACAEIANKYSFVPSDFERDEVQENIEAAAYFWDEEEE